LIRRLATYNLPDPILKGWEERYRGRLLPLQYRAVSEYGLLDGISLLISAPTSSGKTFCGEMAMIRAIQERRKAIFLTPLKAVTEEKFNHFCRAYGDLGLKVIAGTRDHPEYDSDIENGNFDIAVMVYEKFNSLLLTNFDLMGQVGAIVVDEIQMLGEPERGPRLELALTKLLYSSYGPQIVALSAVVGKAHRLAEWLGCRLLIENNRPVELRRGITTEGRFVYRCHNTGLIGEEDMENGDDNIATLFKNIEKAFTDDNQVLVFLKSRYESIRAAEKYAVYAGLEPDPEKRHFIAERLSDEEPSSILDNLKTLLACGVAFHNADLTASQRQAVEDGYRAGIIKAVFSTSTLSTGINLPASTVFIEAQKYQSRTYSGRPGLEPLSWMEYESMSGRAGRVGWNRGDKNEIGRAVLLAGGELEKDILWDFYIDHSPEELTSRLTDLSWPDIIIDILSSELANVSEDIIAILRRSYAGHCCGLHVNDLGETYKQLLDDCFVVDDHLKFKPTNLARATAISGLSMAGARFILTACSDSTELSDLQIIDRLLCSPEGCDINWPGRRGRLNCDMQGHLYEKIGHDPLWQEIMEQKREPNPREQARLLLVLLMSDWSGGLSLLEIENIYHLYPGMMENLARRIGWLASSAAAIAKSMDRLSPLARRIDNLAFSLTRGLPLEMRPLYIRLGELVFRREYMTIFDEGLTAPHQDIDYITVRLKEMVTSDSRWEKINSRISEMKEEKMRDNGKSISTAAVFPAIEIEGTPVRERYRIRIDGHAIDLTGKSFKYLVGLVWSRLTKDNGWLYKEDLEQGFNQARYLYRLRQEIGRDFIPEWPLYENNRSGYYRLVADPKKIKVNLDALKSIPDFEIQRMAADLRPGFVN